MKVRPLKRFKRIMTVPPDKSITHRALIFGALANGKTVIKNPLAALDTFSTIDCITNLGAEVKLGNEWIVRGGKLTGGNLDCGNSGTTMRLLMGVVAGLPQTTVFTGDKSLKSRPMDRITKPLSLMGAKCEGYKITGGELRAINYEIPIPSAQVKSAIILAALKAEGETVLSGRIDSRAHTEIMLKRMGAQIQVENDVIKIKKSTLEPTEFTVGGDPSSAAYATALALLVPDGYAYLRGVECSYERMGFYRKLKESGAEISIDEISDNVANIEVRYSKIMPFVVNESEIPYLIDEIPLLALVACFAQGESTISGVGELKVKESNRLLETAKLIKSLGGEIEIEGDKIRINGKGTLAGGGTYDGNDHRMVMTAAVGCSLSQKEGVVVHPECVEISFPGFFELFE